MLAPLIVPRDAYTGRAPVTTLAGVQAALALAVDAIAIDVQASRDGVPVLLYDRTLDRTTNRTGPASGLSFAVPPRRMRAARLHGPGSFAWIVDVPEDQACVPVSGEGGIVTKVPDGSRKTPRRGGYTGVSAAPARRPRPKQASEATKG